MRELQPIYSSNKSFYKKAWEIYDNNTIKLLSYSTIVAEIVNNELVVHGTYSNTTLRHIKEWLRQHGYAVNTKKEVELYMR
jgi:hypothetical protein